MITFDDDDLLNLIEEKQLTHFVDENGNITLEDDLIIPEARFCFDNVPDNSINPYFFNSVHLKKLVKCKNIVFRGEGKCDLSTLQQGGHIVAPFADDIALPNAQVDTLVVGESPSDSPAKKEALHLFEKNTRLLKISGFGIMPIAEVEKINHSTPKPRAYTAYFSGLKYVYA